MCCNDTTLSNSNVVVCHVKILIYLAKYVAKSRCFGFLDTKWSMLMMGKCCSLRMMGRVIIPKDQTIRCILVMIGIVDLGQDYSLSN